MTSFRTEITPKEWSNKLNYNNKLVLMGSCFSDNIGNKFKHFGFNTIANPFGVIYNPISIANLIERAIEGRLFSESDIRENNGRWFCFETHGDLSASSKEECLQKHNEVLEQTNQFLKQTDYLFITFGTARVYEWSETGDIVGNCHKIPNKEFTKRLVSRKEIISRYEKLFSHSIFDFQTVLTVSPVRHLKDGVIENQESKSILHLSVQQLARQFENCTYFPSYEIMMDDLRDYRFYASDMLHPNQQAIDYIWEKLKLAAIDPDCFDTIQRVDKVRAGLGHRPLNEDSEEYQKFKLKLDSEVKYLKTQGIEL